MCLGVCVCVCVRVCVCVCVVGRGRILQSGPIQYVLVWFNFIIILTNNIAHYIYSLNIIYRSIKYNNNKKGKFTMSECFTVWKEILNNTLFYMRCFDYLVYKICMIFMISVGGN